MRKGRRLIPLVLLLVLTGCSTTDGQGLLGQWIGDRAVSSPGIVNDEAYLQYLALQEEDKLDEAGYYKEYGEYEEYAEYFSTEGEVSEEPENFSEEKERVHITFAENKYLKINYFYDEKRENPIELSECYLDPGESIYASLRQCNNPYTHAYEFAEYRIYAYDDQGNRGQKPILSISNKSAVFTIPDDFTGTELSIEPIGEYQRRELSLQAFIVDGDGHKTAFPSGTWRVDDKEYKEGVSQLDPGTAYTVKYSYPSDVYYYVTAEPEPYSSGKDGEVEFRKATSMDTNYSYEVQLHAYLSAVLEENIKYIEAIEVEGSPYSDDAQTKTRASIKQLKVGDRISIVTKEGYRLFCSQFSLGEPEKLDNNRYRYSFTVPELKEEIRIRVSKSLFKVSIADNVGNDISFDIKAAGFQKSGLVYEKKGLNNSCEVINDTIGAEEAVTVSAQGKGLSETHVLRLYVEKKDNNNNTTKDTKYISSLPGDQIIGIYENGDADNSSKIYKEVNIEISLVEAVPYQKEAVENGALQMYLVDTNAGRELQEGDYLEASTRIKVVLQPSDGYYVSGRKVDDDNCYRAEMKYKDYDFAELMEEHPIKKFILVTLDASDEYGTCVYKIGGEEVSGEKALQEGQKLTLEYTLTDSDYQIVRESEGFLGGIRSWGANTFSKNEESVEIEITPELDGTVITRDSYIQVDKK